MLPGNTKGTAVHDTGMFTWYMVYVIYSSIGTPIRNTYLERASGSYFVGPRPGQFLMSGLLSTQGAETRFSYRYTSCCTSIFLIHGGYSQRVPRASNVLRSLFFVSFLFSSLRTSCGLRCRPVFPPVRAFRYYHA